MGERILLVDDNVAFIDSVKDVLEVEGCVVDTAHSGEDAVAMVENADYALVLMDIKMPGMNGVECFLKMKASNPRVRVILITAYALTDLIKTACDNGVWAVMKKPLDMGTLMQTIATARQETACGCILVADDDRALCDNLYEILSANGYHVAVACDGQAAIDLADKQPFDILLLDLKLPERNGLEVYRHIKAKQPHLMKILMTGYADEMKALIDQAISESVYTFMTKPLKMEQLLKLVDEVAQAHKSGIIRKPAIEGL
jgi:two-component system, NtrC family, response regulator HydG